MYLWRRGIEEKHKIPHGGREGSEIVDKSNTYFLNGP